MHRIIEGALAGAVGATVINAATNMDMLVRGRPASTVPSDLVAEVAEDVGIARPESELDDQEATKSSNRFSGAGALMGVLAGVCGGVAYSVAPTRIRSLPLPVTSAGLGLGVMAVTDTSAALAGVTEPGSWGAKSWAADAIPHLLYGLSTAAVIQRLRARTAGRRPAGA